MYATQADLVARFGESEIGQVGDTDGSGEVDPALIVRALADADAEINAALASRYQLPLPSVPPMLTRIACDLARFNLYTDEVSDVVAMRYKRAVAMLADIASGKLSLGLPEAPPSSGDGAVVLVKSPERVFGPDLGY